MVLVVRYGRDRKADKFKVTPKDGKRLDDDEWHDLYFTRRNKQVYINSASTSIVYSPIHTADAGATQLASC